MNAIVNPKQLTSKELAAIYRQQEGPKRTPEAAAERLRTARARKPVPAMVIRSDAAEGESRRIFDNQQPTTEGSAQTSPFDSTVGTCNHVLMPDRNMRIVRFIGATPSVAYCDVCRLTFRTRQEFLLDSDKAREQLQSDFEKHECRPEPGAVNEALDHIR